MDGSGSAGSSVLHSPCVGVTVAQAPRHALAGATVHGDRFENALPLVRQRAIRCRWIGCRERWVWEDKDEGVKMESASKRDGSGGIGRDNR